MGVGTMTENQPKAAITVSKMCSLLGMSRSQFYWHVKKGTFHPPLKLSNGRPYYNASQVEDNLKAKEIGIGVNGEYVLFYQQRDTEPTARATVVPAKPKPADFSDLIEGLNSLGLSGINNTTAAQAVEACYPKGVAGVDENEFLRAVFRHLKRSGAG